MTIKDAIDEVKRIAKRCGYDGALSERAIKACAEVYLENCNEEGMPLPRKYMRSGKNHNPTHLNEIQWLIVRTDNFKKWFGKSVVVDENGDPKLMYHGTWKSFNSFKTSSIKLNKVAMTLWSGPGFYFTDNTRVADIYAGSDTEKNIYSVFLRLENPLVVDETGNCDEGIGITKKEAERIFLDGDNTQWLDSGLAKELAKLDDEDGVSGKGGKHYYKNLSRQQRVLLYVNRLKTDVVKLKTAAQAFGAKSQKQLLASICKHTGYDGVIHTITPEVKEWVVYNPSAIKSATDNNGEFSFHKTKVEDSMNTQDIEKGSPNMFNSLIESLAKLVGNPAEVMESGMDIVDRNGRHHQPKAIPEGGQFEEEGQYLTGQAKVDAAIRNATSGKRATLMREHVAPLYAKLGVDSATRAKIQAMHEDIRGLNKNALLKGLSKHMKDVKRHAEAYNSIKDMGKEEFKEWLNQHPEYKTAMTDKLLSDARYNKQYAVQGGYHDDGTGKQKHQAWEEAKWSVAAKACASLILCQEHADAIHGAPDAIMANMIERAMREEPAIENHEAPANEQIVERQDEHIENNNTEQPAQATNPIFQPNADGDIDVALKNITSLQGAPSSVSGILECSNNQLTNLLGAPSRVGGRVYFTGNPNLPQQAINDYITYLRNPDPAHTDATGHYAPFGVDAQGNAYTSAERTQVVQATQNAQSAQSSGQSQEHANAQVGQSNNRMTYTDHEGNTHDIEHNPEGLKGTIHPSELGAVQAEMRQAFADAANDVEGAEEYAHALSHFLGRGRDNRSQFPGMRADGVMKHQLAEKMEQRLASKQSALEAATTDDERAEAQRDIDATKKAVKKIASILGISGNDLPEGNSFANTRALIAGNNSESNTQNEQPTQAAQSSQAEQPAQANNGNQSQSQETEQLDDRTRTEIVNSSGTELENARILARSNADSMGNNNSFTRINGGHIHDAIVAKFRLNREATELHNQAEAARERGDSEEFTRLNDESVAKQNQAMAISHFASRNTGGMSQRNENGDFTHTMGTMARRMSDYLAGAWSRAVGRHGEEGAENARGVKGAREAIRTMGGILGFTPTFNRGGVSFNWNDHSVSSFGNGPTAATTTTTNTSSQQTAQPTQTATATQATTAQPQQPQQPNGVTQQPTDNNAEHLGRRVDANGRIKYNIDNNVGTASPSRYQWPFSRRNPLSVNQLTPELIKQVASNLPHMGRLSWRRGRVCEGMINILNYPYANPNYTNNLLDRMTSSNNVHAKRYKEIFNALHPGYMAQWAQENARRVAEANNRRVNQLAEAANTVTNNRAPEDQRINISDSDATDAVNRITQHLGEDNRAQIEQAMHAFRENGTIPGNAVNLLREYLPRNHPVVSAIRDAAGRRANEAERFRIRARDFVPEVPEATKNKNRQLAADNGVEFGEPITGHVDKEFGFNCYLAALVYSMRRAGIKIPKIFSRPNGYGMNSQKYFIPTKIAMANAGWEPVQGATYQETTANLERLARTKPNGYTIECWSSAHHGTHAFLLDGKWVFTDVYSSRGDAHTILNSKQLSSHIAPVGRNGSEEMSESQKRIATIAILKGLPVAQRMRMTQEEKDNYVKEELKRSRYIAESSFGHSPEQGFTDELIKQVLRT